MKISYNWLKEYINIDLPAAQLSYILTDIGLEIEKMEHVQSIEGGLKGIFVGEVLTKKKHPAADKLSLTTVDIGGERPLHIVCGAPNVAAGQKVVVAPIGTTLYGGEKPFLMKKMKIRGELSEGMICAEDEIGTGKSHDGILVLSEEARVGAAITDYIPLEEDYTFEIGITPNRVDGTSHIGVARDLVAFFKQTQDMNLQLPSVANFQPDNNDFPIEISIESADCKRYTGVCLSDIEVAESPTWLKKRLESIGLTSINNVVDITNFVMHETGQPLHAFDADKIAGNKVIIKNLEEGAVFKTLDEVERKLSAEDLMICNQEEGMCMAGVFGGFDSGVSENTKHIFIESAHFEPVAVRKTSKRHELKTDSSYRFERGADVNMTVFALKRAALLIKEVAGGQISSNIVDVYPEVLPNYQVNLSYKNLNRLIGKEIEKEKVKRILTALGIKILTETADELALEVPRFRYDVTREADIIEEVLRIYGYNNIEFSTQVKSALSYTQKPDNYKVKRKISELLSNSGYNEAMFVSLTKSAYYENLKGFSNEKLVKVSNPISLDMNSLRQSLLPGMLEGVAHNFKRKNKNLRLYEFGNCYFKAGANEKTPVKGYFEEFHLALINAGNKMATGWKTADESVDFFDLKSDVLKILHRVGLQFENFRSTEISDDIFAYGIKLNLFKNPKAEIKMGLIKSELLQQFDIKQDVFYADFTWYEIVKTLQTEVKYKKLSKYPSMKRDLALLLDADVKFEDLRKLAFKTDKKILKAVSIFDVYMGKNMPAGKKSYALSFVFQDPDKTLVDKRVDKIMNKLIFLFEKQFGASIR